MSNAMKNILIVGDIVPYIEMEKGLLKRSDIKIFSATSEKDAMDIHRSKKMNLIILDLDMIGMKGDDICRRIRSDERLKNVSVLMICMDRERDLERCRECGANGYITRPLNAEEFEKKVSSLIDIHHRQSYKILVRVSIKGDVGSVPFICSSRDISSTGMSLETEHAVSKGSVIETSFYMSDGKMIKADADVIRVIAKENGEFLYGIKFLNLNSGQADIIEKFIEKHSQ